jgi:hypothetical protein
METKWTKDDSCISSCQDQGWGPWKQKGLSLITEGEITSHIKLKLKQLMISKPVLQKIIKEILHIEKEYQYNHENKSHQMTKKMKWSVGKNQALQKATKWHVLLHTFQYWHGMLLFLILQSKDIKWWIRLNSKTQPFVTY